MTEPSAKSPVARGPLITIGDRQYEGRALRADAWQPHWARLIEIEAGSPARTTLEAIGARIDLYRRYLRAVFPRRWWQPWSASVAERVMARPLAEVEEIVAHCFHHHIVASLGSDAVHDAIRQVQRAPAEVAAVHAADQQRGILWQ